MCILSKTAEASHHRIGGLEGNLADMWSSPPQSIFLCQKRLHSYERDREEKYIIIHSTSSQHDPVSRWPILRLNICCINVFVVGRKIDFFKKETFQNKILL